MRYEPGGEAVEIGEEEMPSCCAITVLGEAEWEGDKDMVSFERCLKSILSGKGDYRRTSPGLYIYTLDQDQTAEKAALLKAGFEAGVGFVSPGSKNTITLYTKKVNQPTARARTRAPATRRRRQTA